VISITSQALDQILRTLRVSGAQGQASSTQFADGVLDQVLDVSALVRRGLTLSPASGLYVGVIEATHPGADAQSESVDPYNPGTFVVNVSDGAVTGSGYPAIVNPNQFDVWLFGATVQSTIMAEGILQMSWPTTSVGWQAGGDNDNPGAPLIPVAAWDGIEAINTRTWGYSEIATADNLGSIYKRIGLRVPNGTIFRFDTTSTGAGNTFCRLNLGLFPAGLGQDGAV